MAYNKNLSDFSDSLSVPINLEHRDSTVISHPSLDILNKKTNICTSDSKRKLTRQVMPCNDSKPKCEETCITLKLLYSALSIILHSLSLSMNYVLYVYLEPFFQAIFILPTSHTLALARPT